MTEMGAKSFLDRDYQYSRDYQYWPQRLNLKILKITDRYLKDTGQICKMLDKACLLNTERPTDVN